MKTFFYFILIAASFFTGCKKDTANAIVIIDCTGTYLRIDNKAYNVCNLDKVAGFADGAKVNVSFQQSTDCEEANDRIVCMKLYPNAGWIRVNSIKPG